MNINTSYGSIEYDVLAGSNLSAELLSYFANRKQTAELFFAADIDLMGESTPEILELAELMFTEHTFSDPSRVFALVKCCDVEFSLIEEMDPTLFLVGEKEYLVLLDTEAYNQAIEKKIYELESDFNLDKVDKSTRLYIYHHCIDTEWFDEHMNSDLTNHIYNLQENSLVSSDEYLNCLHEELVNRKLMTEPIYPIKDNFEEDDDYQSERTAYVHELEAIINDKKDVLLQSMISDYSNSLDYWIQTVGIEELPTVIQDNQLMDIPKVAHHLVDTNGIAIELASYDGDEHYVTGTYKGEQYEYYIYRQY